MPSLTGSVELKTTRNSLVGLSVYSGLLTRKFKKQLKNSSMVANGLKLPSKIHEMFLRVNMTITSRIIPSTLLIEVLMVLNMRTLLL